MKHKRDDGAGLRRLPPEDAAEAVRRTTDQADREDEFDRSMEPKPKTPGDTDADDPKP